MPLVPRALSVTAMTTRMSADVPWVMKLFDAVQHPAVAVAHRRRAHRRGVAARAGLGQPPGRQGPARRPAARRSAASAPSEPNIAMWADAQAVVRRHRQRHRRIDPGQLLEGDAVVHRRHAGAAVGARGSGCPSVPRSASAGSSSDGKCCASSHSRTWGRISRSANSRTLRASRDLFFGEGGVEHERSRPEVGGGRGAAGRPRSYHCDPEVTAVRAWAWPPA